MTLRRLPRDRRAVTAIEFAFVAPVLLLLLMGFAELCYEAYVQAVLTGAVQKGGRDLTIEGASSTTTSIDSAVEAQVSAAAPRASYTVSRKSYASFGYIDPEPFTDTNGNGVRDSGECFTDINGNGSWDADPGTDGVGGADNAVVYTVTATFPRLFPLQAWLGWGSTDTISATTILKNQPYATQSTSTPETVCT